MSQAGIIDFTNSDPQIPTSIITDSGTAIPLNNELEILGGDGIDTSGAANVVTITAETATYDNKGIASFDSTMFTVTDGHVSLVGGGAGVDSIAVQAGTSPVVPDGAGLVTINGATTASGTNPVRTNGTGANTLAVEVQLSQAIPLTDATKVGLCNFNSADFTVDASGFVTLAGAGAGQTITGDSGGALSPTAGNWNIVGGAGIATSGSGSTLTISSSGDASVIQVFTTTGANTYTPTSGMKYCIVEVVGAGGGGGGAQSVGAAQCAGGGGGAGAYARGVFSAATVGPSQTVTIGTGGTGGTAVGGTGGTGGTSSFGTLISCTGGVGGVGVAADNTNAASDGGAGGTASGTGVSFGVTGTKGSPALWINTGGAGLLFCLSGAGAPSVLGTGGTYRLTIVGTPLAGIAGSQGGGGSGGERSGSAGGSTGGAGGDGIVVITEFISV